MGDKRRHQPTVVFKRALRDSSEPHLPCVLSWSSGSNNKGLGYVSFQTSATIVEVIIRAWMKERLGLKHSGPVGERKLNLVISSRSDAAKDAKIACGESFEYTKP